MNSGAGEVADVAQDGGAVADMDQCVATILADGEIRARNPRLDLPGNLCAGISPRYVADMGDLFRARSESRNWPQRWNAETRPCPDHPGRFRRKSAMDGVDRITASS
jgi:hypothetical protein